MIKNPLLLALLAAAALALGACGSGKDDNSSGSSRAKAEDKAFEGALKFAKCMRDHGLDVPDPKRGPNGGITQTMGRRGGKGTGPSDIDQGKMEAAQKDCEHFMKGGGGEAPSPAAQAKQQDAFLAYARCMRQHGIAMPDPKFSNGRVEMRLGSPGQSGPNPESATFKAADKTCHPKLAQVEKSMMKEQQ
ncbi:MAG TPA: hypothetical protein VNT55_16605 [Baekduia sp.]|nr:hypothetical protein [Baekduia sp.]